ncbi:MAG: toll/interleukin-1 receptor domain-containing protein [Alphaproteobacteria bacterium]|nr:toll/interleukin-1 receptor domain-containing protein [Alphaproteobacteria bacterium]
MTKATARVFISYSRTDIALADRLAEGLRERGFSALLDRTDIAVGEPWQERLSALIAAADTVAFLISPPSVASRICDWELKESARLGKRIIPVVCRPVPDASVPEALARLNWIVATADEDFPRALAQLDEALRTDLGWVREHTRLMEIALHWDQHGRPKSALLRGGDLEQAERWLGERPEQSGAPVELHRGLIHASRAAARFRTRTWAIGASGIAVLAVVLAGFAEVSRRDAVVQRDAAERARVQAQTQQARADRALQTAVGAANTFTDTIALELRDAIGMPAPLVKRILEPAIALQDKLKASGETGTALQNSQIDTLSLMALTLGRIGETEAARAAAGRAVDLARALVAANPNAHAPAGRLLASLGALADIELQSGHEPAAEALDREKLALARRAVAPADSSRHQLLIALTDLDHVLEKSNRFAESRPLLEEALPIARANWERKHSDDAAEELGTVLQNLGVIETRTDHPAAALPRFEEALAVQQAKAAPPDASHLRSLALLHQNIALVSATLNDKARALAAVDASIATVRVLAADRRNGATQSLLANILFTSGGLRFAWATTTEEKLAGMAILRESLAVSRALASDPANADAANVLVGRLLVVARTRDPAVLPDDEARGYVAEAVAILRRLQDTGRLPGAELATLKQAEALAAGLGTPKP